VGVKDKHGKTPLEYAREKGLASMVRMLEEAQASQGSVGRLSPPGLAPGGPAAAPSPRSDVDFPPTIRVKPRPAAYAVVIGVEQYRNHLPQAAFAAQDAKVIGAYLSHVMGYREEHIAVLLNDKAAKADLEKYIEHWLPRRVERDASVFIYFSGHGAPDAKTSEAYLVPYDGDPAFLEATGYPLKRLYDQLRKLSAKEIVVILDACFSGAGGRSVIAKGLRPVGISVEHQVLAGGNIAVLSASSGQQAAGTYEQQGHGLLTYFVLKGLRGEADQNEDGAIELAELYRYVKPEIEVKARRDLNLEQTPQLLGASELLAKGIRLVERVQQ
ncbi:MAG: caspase family protein, partial [Methylocella sp.]